MKKLVFIYRMILFLLFCIAFAFYQHIGNMQKIYYHLFSSLYSIRTFLFLIIGMFINSIGNELGWRRKNYGWLNLAATVFCVLVIFLPFLISSYLPSSIMENLALVQIILALYAGANLNIIFLGRFFNKQISGDNIKQ